MKTKFLFSALFMTSLLSGCGGDEDFVQTEKTDFLCSQAENKLIDGSDGFRDVVILDNSGSETTIGYENNGTLVPHSECSAAIKKSTGSEVSYSWYQYGQVTPSNDNDSVISLEFSSYGDQTRITATRKPNVGVPSTEIVELPAGDSDSKNASIKQKIWKAEVGVSEITASNNFDGSTFMNVIALNGDVSKEIRFNQNTNEWDCIYSNNGHTTLDNSCANEASNDLAIVGFNLDLIQYYESLSDVVRFEVDSSELDDDINRFYSF